MNTIKRKPTTKIEALAEFLGLDDTHGISENNDSSFDVGNRSYLVMTDEEADQACADSIRDSVWAYRASFLRTHMGLPHEAEKMLETFAREKCEGANDTFIAMIKDFDAFVSDSISADGRGHFLAGYDSHENESGEYLIYRTN